MSVELSFISKQEVVRKIKEKYNLIKKKDKSGIIDNLVSLTEYDRKLSSVTQKIKRRQLKLCKSC